MPRFAHIFFLLIFPLLIFSQDSGLKTYTTADGLPESAIYDCVQADNGNMWFASEHVLIEYDGKNWISHDSLDGQNPGHSFRFIKKDEQGTLWAFSEYLNESIWFLKDGVWNFTSTNIDNRENLIVCDVEFVNGELIILLITEASDIVLFKNNVATQLSNKLFKEISIFDGEIVDNKLLLATSKGLIYYDPITKIITQTNWMKNESVYSIDIDSNNNQIYFLTGSAIGLVKEDILVAEYGVPHIQYYKNHTNRKYFKRSTNGDFYFGTKYINYRFSPDLNLLQKLGPAIGYPTHGATSVFIDYEKNIWLTSLRGINKIRNTPFTNFNTANNLLESEVTSIEKFPSGPIIIGHNNGFSVLDKNVIKTIPFSDKQNEVFARIMDMSYCARDDAIWFVSEKLGLGYLTRDLKVYWSVRVDPEEPTSFMCLYIDENDKKYFATSSGFTELIDKRTTEVISDISLIVRQIYEYNRDTLIVATRKGVLLYDKAQKSYQVFNQSNKLKNEVYSLLNIDDHNWLVGTNGGLLLFDGRQLTEFNDLIIDKPIYFINRENEYIWFGLMGGALRWNPESGEKRLFSTFEGLSGIETNRDAFLFDDDKVYIGTNSGLSIFVPDRFDEEYFKVKPMINFNGFFDLSGNKYELHEDFALSYQENDIELRYISPSFIDEDGLEYFIEVYNEDDNSSSKYVTSRGSYILQNLPTSSFYISLFSKNSYGISSDTLRSARITIPPPFYLEFWFLGLVVLIALSATYAIYDYLIKSRYSKQLEIKVEQRTEQLLKSEKNIRDLTQRIFTAQEEEREKIARDLHDNIAQEMALVKLEVDKIAKEGITPTDINYQWLTNKLTELTKYLRDLSYFLHPNTIKQTGFVNAIQSMCNEFSSLSKIHIEFYSNITDSFSISEEVSTNIYRFVQEALTNIRKHSKAESGIVIIVTKDNYLTVRIEDDGTGFELSEEIKTSKSRSMGLKSMEERIRFVGGTLSIKSGKDEGTKLNAKIPLSRMDQLSYSTKLDHESGS